MIESPITDLDLVIDSTRLCLRGDIHFKNVCTVLKLGTTAIQSMPIVHVDMQNVRNSDSSGLALLVAYLRTAHEYGKTIAFINVPSFIQDIAHVYGLHEVLNLSWAN